MYSSTISIHALKKKPGNYLKMLGKEQKFGFLEHLQGERVRAPVNWAISARELNPQSMFTNL